MGWARAECAEDARLELNILSPEFPSLKLVYCPRNSEFRIPEFRKRQLSYSNYGLAKIHVFVTCLIFKFNLPEHTSKIDDLI